MTFATPPLTMAFSSARYGPPLLGSISYLVLLTETQHKGFHHMWSLFCHPCSTSFDRTAQAMEVGRWSCSTNADRADLISTTAPSMALETSTRRGFKHSWIALSNKTKRVEILSGYLHVKSAAWNIPRGRSSRKYVHHGSSNFRIEAGLTT